MDKQQIISKAKQIVDPARQSQLLYECLDALGIKYQKSTCHKCRRDLFAILLEELDLIEDASEFSGWDNSEFTWIFSYPRPVRWNGKIINKNTNKVLLTEFCEENPSLCLKQYKIDFNN